MPYSALPDMRIPWDNDGTVAGFWNPTQGVRQWVTGTSKAANLNGYAGALQTGPDGGCGGFVWFFPEQREFTAVYAMGREEGGNGAMKAITAVTGSNDSVNVLDGTWETASMAGGYPAWENNYSWRSGIKPVSFTGGKKVVRLYTANSYGCLGYYYAHAYGEKVAGQTPDDVIYIDHDTTPGVEFGAAEDFGDRPLATTVVRQFRIKNTSATKTANSLNIQCNDADFVISTDGSTWVVTINIGSLAAGAESGTMYVRNTTPAAGSLIGPRFARIVAIVGSWT